MILAIFPLKSGPTQLRIKWTALLFKESITIFTLFGFRLADYKPDYCLLYPSNQFQRFNPQGKTCFICGIIRKCLKMNCKQSLDIILLNNNLCKYLYRVYRLVLLCIQGVLTCLNMYTGCINLFKYVYTVYYLV